ncbi:hypothetical protein [Natrarchaeobius oligotrophus]|uniref:Zinc ribbon domain-containing protein n=1 Tax=Natrarchaeobius chitinivorans TaxID=1679083 RepID=A0A3N6MDV6_NATCH|nr:hypothetical protein [Natrarchaeobius chitinivorans]RQG93751.1 hypothetical protein EA472_22740 [Natrarchaeobius chitinivorans]
MTGGSYTNHCPHCETRITAASRYCRSCGQPQDWFDDRDDVHPDLREAYRTMLSRARAVDADPANEPPRSFEHAFRLLVPTANIDVLQELVDDE